MEEQKFDKINEQDATVVNEGAAQTTNEKAAEEVKAEKTNKHKKAKIIGIVVGSTVVIGAGIAGIVYYTRKGKGGKAVATFNSTVDATRELALKALDETPAQLAEAANEVGMEVTQF